MYAITTGRYEHLQANQKSGSFIVFTLYNYVYVIHAEPIGHVNEYPTMRYFGNYKHTWSMMFDFD